MSDTASSFLQSFLVALAVSIGLALLERSSRKSVKADFDGWVRISLSPFMLVAAIFGFPSGALIIGVSLIPYGIGSPSIPDVLFSIAMFAVGALMTFAAYRYLFIRIKFNVEGVKIDHLFRTRFASWSFIRVILFERYVPRHGSFSDGRLIIQKQFQGVAELIDEAQKHGVRVDFDSAVLN